MMNVSTFEYSNPDRVFSQEQEQLQEIPHQIEFIKAYNRRQLDIKLAQQEKGPGAGGSRRRTLKNRTKSKVVEKASRKEIRIERLILCVFSELKPAAMKQPRLS
jgi:hypothetical protein